MKKKTYLLLTIFFMLVFIFSTSSKSVSALTTEGSTNENSGGIVTYTNWFENNQGLLLIAADFPNASGIIVAEITVVVACVDEDQLFRLRIYDSDVEEYINPEKEVGMGSLQRRFSVRPHMDKDHLTWTVQVTEDDGTTVLAKMVLIYSYDANASHKPIDDEGDKISIEEHKKELEEEVRKEKTKVIIGTTIASGVGVVGAIFWIRRIK